MAEIYIDMDDVLTQSCHAFLKTLRQEFNKNATYEQITDFNLQVSFGLSDEDYAHFFSCIHTPDALFCQAPVEGAKDTISRWKKNGHRINILTGRPPETRDISIKWLVHNEFEFDSFSIVNKYGRQASKENNVMTLQALSTHSFDFAVEDSVTMAKFLSREMGVPVALLDRPWNRDILADGNIRRCSDWSRVDRLMEDRLTAGCSW